MKFINAPENIRKSKKTEQPEIVVSLRPHASNVQCLMLCIENIGSSPAYNVEFVIRFRTRAFGTSSANVDDFKLLVENNFLQNGIGCFGSGQKIEEFLISLTKDLSEELKQPFQISVTYVDSLNHRYEKKYVLAFGDFENFVHIDSKEKKAISDLVPLLADVRQALNQIAESTECLGLSKTSKTMDSKAQSQETEEHIETVEDDQDKPLSPELEIFVNLYNAGSDVELEQNYGPVSSLRVTNERERFQNPNIPPVFETRSNGSFVTYVTASENLYAVVPLSGLTLQNALYSSGAFGEVFECPGFNREHTYRVKVVRPALFKHNSINDEWTLEKKGKLELTQKDK